MKVHEEQRVEALEKLQQEQGVSNRLREDLERLGKDKDELNKKLNNIESEIDEVWQFKSFILFCTNAD